MKGLEVCDYKEECNKNEEFDNRNKSCFKCKMQIKKNDEYYSDKTELYAKFKILQYKKAKEQFVNKYGNKNIKKFRYKFLAAVSKYWKELDEDDKDNYEDLNVDWLKYIKI